MKNSIEYYISQLLYKNDCVILMNFGGFVCSSISANLNKKTGILTPPSKSILFNSQLKDNDGLLINHIAQAENISQENAKLNLLKFVNQSLENLNKFKSCRFEEIGLFTLNSDGNIIFTQDLKRNYNLNAFGFQDVINNNITRDNSEIIEESLKLIKQKNNFTAKRLLKAAAIIIPLIGLSFLSITQEDRINNIYTQIANVNPISFKKDNVTVLKDQSNKEIKIKQEIQPEIINNEVSQVFKEVIIPNQKFYIIAGAFSIEKNANKLKNRLNSWNYNSSIIKNDKMMRVSYDSFDSKEQALISLSKIRKENPQAWILTI
ncbi:SPOR domain-containing protein [Flavobacteriales bacterium]|nr:SPOR domain-containing protein [Flavobacteriales bacterium]